MERLTKVSLISALMLMGCESQPVAPSDLVGTTWRLVSLHEAGSVPIRVEDPSRYTLRLDEGGTLAVMSDCNSCGGTYALTGGSLDFDRLTCTRAFCGEDSLDAAYVRALDRARSASTNNAELIVQAEGTTLQFTR